MSEVAQNTKENAPFGLLEPDVIRNPGEYFEKLRSECPVTRTDDLGGFWIVSRYEDVKAAARQTDVFSSSAGVSIPSNPPPYAPAPCLEQDDPEHGYFRQPMQPWFSPGRIAALEDDVRALVSALIDAVIDDGRCNAASAIAEPIPPTIIANMLGIPRSEWPWFRERTEMFLKSNTAGDVDSAGAAIGELYGYFGERLEERRVDPQQDMFTDIVNLTVNGDPITTEEAVALAFLLMVAGHETTTGAISGMIYQVAKHPGARDRLLQEPSLVTSCIEESLRLETSLMGLGRTAMEDTVVAGVSIAKDDRVMLMWGSANRDGSVFENPESFIVDRPNNRHLAFGSGVHRCIGAPLARLELRVTLEEILRRMPGIHLENEDEVAVTWALARNFHNLPIAW
jgi:cytochrome P450